MISRAAKLDRAVPTPPKWRPLGVYVIAGECRVRDRGQILRAHLSLPGLGGEREVP